MHVEHRSDEEPGGDLTGKFAQPGREREGQNGNLCFAEAMTTFLIVLFRGPMVLMVSRCPKNLKIGILAPYT